MKKFLHLWQYLVEFFLEWEMFWAKLVQEMKTFYLQQPFVESRAVCEIILKNMTEPEEPQMTSKYGAFDLHAK